ncbi:hypothetical protein BGX34_001505, partial [Mortierella sp. NVP85]
DPRSDNVKGRSAAISFKPTTMEDFLQHTNRTDPIPLSQKSFHDPMAFQVAQGFVPADTPQSRDFFTLTLPGKIQLDHPSGGILVQIQNHDR